MTAFLFQYLNLFHFFQIFSLDKNVSIICIRNGKGVCLILQPSSNFGDCITNFQVQAMLKRWTVINIDCCDLIISVGLVDFGTYQPDWAAGHKC